MFSFCVVEIVCGLQDVSRDMSLARCPGHCQRSFDFIFLGGWCFWRWTSFVSVHLDHVQPLALDLWPLWLLRSSEHKDHSEKKHRDKEKLKHSDSSSDKHREKHKEKDKDKEKRREEKVCQWVVSLPYMKGCTGALSVNVMFLFFSSCKLYYFVELT